MQNVLGIGRFFGFGKVLASFFFFFLSANFAQYFLTRFTLAYSRLSRSSSTLLLALIYSLMSSPNSWSIAMGSSHSSMCRKLLRFSIAVAGLKGSYPGDLYNIQAYLLLLTLFDTRRLAKYMCLQSLLLWKLLPASRTTILPTHLCHPSQCSYQFLMLLCSVSSYSLGIGTCMSAE